MVHILQPKQLQIALEMKFLCFPAEVVECNFVSYVLSYI